MKVEQTMPSANEMARVLSNTIAAKLANLHVERIELDRDEATLCLGLLNGLVETLEAETVRKP